MNRQFVLWVLAIGLGACGPAADQASEAPAAPKPTTSVSIDAATQRQLGIEVKPVQTRNISSSVSATGQLQLNEERTWRVGSITDGRIVSISVTLGETVETGQILVRLHSHEVHDARADQRNAAAELERSKALLEQARRVRDRTRRLYELKAASGEQLDAAETQHRSAELAVVNAETEVHRNETHLTEYLDVPLKEQGDTTADHNEANQIPIKSPARGTVIERLASVGTVVSAAAPVVTISDLSSLWLIAAVNESDLARIMLNQTVLITVRAYPNRTFRGTVFRLGEKLDPETRSLQVRVLVSNTSGLLKPEMFASVSILGAPSGGLICVPETALQEIEGKQILFVESAPGSFAVREVVPGRRLSGQVEIVSGLALGTPVVMNGAFLLKSHLLKGE